ncbi:MAG: threonine/serine dehydratase [Sulfitobacter sp.]
MADTGISDITLNAMTARLNALAQDVVRTPAVALNTPMTQAALEGGRVTLKLECLQHTGTFKARGALSNARAIPEGDRTAGITAASAGNHAIAAAWAARSAGMSAKVVMQNTANPFRIERARAEGAEVVLRDPGAATFGEAERLSRDEGRTFIHPFDGINTVLGTSGVGLELMEQVPDLDAVIISVGGGGLISGVAAAVKAVNPACKVYGVEPIGAAAMSLSLARGEPSTIEKLDTIADSLAPPMALPMGHALCAAYVDKIVTVSDDAICAGMVVLQQEAKLAVEPAAGAAMAGVLGPLRSDLSGKHVGIIVCGANIDADTYAQQLIRGAPHVPRF